MVAFTGVSGSGKSSLAFGTLYAEAQRRYFESVAPYARRLLQQVGAPHVQEITGLPPAVALQQRRGAATSRSSVGTITTLSNLLRMLYSRAGDYPAGADHLAAEAFSPNTAAGACPRCHGLGVVHDVTEELLVPDPSLSIRDGAIAAWPGAWQGANLRSIVTGLGIDIDRPWRRLQEEGPRLAALHRRAAVGAHRARARPRRLRLLREVLERPQARHARAGRLQERADARAGPAVRRGRALPRLPRQRPAAGGARGDLRSGARSPRSTTCRSPSWSRCCGPVAELPEETNEVAVRICADLVARVEVLLDLGLGYLSLGRSSTTLSPGEAQRLRIATQLRSGLFGVVYVLDEPSAGLHPADAEPLLDVLDRLKASGNSLFVVEHDLDVVRRADWVVDIGPGAGEAGGRVLYSGPVAGLEDVAESATSAYLFGRAERLEHDVRAPQGWLRLAGVRRHNLRDLSVDIPLCVLTAVTGVSGSGKSTLVSQVLAEDPTALESFDRLVLVDQRPIGRTPRSNLATYTGMFDAVRKLYAATDEARARGYGAGRFSFNVAEGRCETCQGEGFVAVELLFLPGTYAPCPTCHGARYNAETLEITYRDKNIAEVLALSVDDAATFLADVPAAARSLQTLREVGLGYLRLGQPATELSGGEAQRIKLATELQRARRGHALYLLDEPTSGLHPADIALLLRQLHRLVDAGNTVVLVEHDLDAIATADWVIDLGPGGGDAGGRVVATGTPADVAKAEGQRDRAVPRAAARPDLNSLPASSPRSVGRGREVADVEDCWCEEFQPLVRARPASPV